MTITELARSCGLSRGTILYYESIGLVKPAGRTPAGYRIYGPKDQARLRRICSYRSAGLTLDDIRTLLDAPHPGGAAGVLRRRLEELGQEIGRLREHQHSVARLLGTVLASGRNQMVTKEKWISIMRSAGFAEDDMKRWHAEFEKMAPAEHQEFLEFLHIPAAEITQIREWSRQGAAK
jgi:DNA-binding transcriptional MerR regulator